MCVLSQLDVKPFDLPRGWFSHLMFNFIPEQWRERTWVAGGAAVDIERASDIDLWIVAGKDFARARGQVYEMMHERGWDAFFVGDEAGSGSLHDLVYSKPHAFLDKTVQVLVTDFDTPQKLVDSFDVSTHAVAKRQDGVVMDIVFSKKFTDLSQLPVVMRYDTPRNTLARVWKISERYGLEPRLEDVTRLANLARGAMATPKAA